jgi:hypothetical protein
MGSTGQDDPDCPMRGPCYAFLLKFLTSSAESITMKKISEDVVQLYCQRQAETRILILRRHECGDYIFTKKGHATRQGTPGLHKALCN